MQNQSNLLITFDTELKTALCYRGNYIITLFEDLTPFLGFRLLLLMRSKRMRYKMPSVSCFVFSAWKFMPAYIYMTVTLRGAGGRGLFNTLNSC